MFEKIIGKFQEQSGIEAMYMWKWNVAHPYLYTIIKISDSFLYLIVAYAGYTLIRKVMKKN